MTNSGSKDFAGSARPKLGLFNEHHEGIEYSGMDSYGYGIESVKIGQTLAIQ